MLEITHQEARAFLQAAVDSRLGAKDKSALAAHLATCQDCEDYAKKLTNLEERLRQMLHTRLDEIQPNLNLQVITKPSPVKLIWNNLLNQSHPLGKVTILVTLLLGYFMIANLFGLQLPNTDDETPTIIPTPNELAFATSPTPSVNIAPASLTTQTCETIRYVVQTNDTLESIAFQHGITKETIMEFNDDKRELASNLVFTGTELILPICAGTPSQTATKMSTPLTGTIYPVKPE